MSGVGGSELHLDVDPDQAIRARGKCETLVNEVASPIVLFPGTDFSSLNTHATLLLIQFSDLFPVNRRGCKNISIPLPEADTVSRCEEVTAHPHGLNSGTLSKPIAFKSM